MRCIHCGIESEAVKEWRERIFSHNYEVRPLCEDIQDCWRRRDALVFERRAVPAERIGIAV